MHEHRPVSNGIRKQNKWIQSHKSIRAHRTTNIKNDNYRSCGETKPVNFQHDQSFLPTIIKDAKYSQSPRIEALKNVTLSEQTEQECKRGMAPQINLNRNCPPLCQEFHWSMVGTTPWIYVREDTKSWIVNKNEDDLLLFISHRHVQRHSPKLVRQRRITCYHYLYDLNEHHLGNLLFWKGTCQEMQTIDCRHTLCAKVVTSRYTSCLGAFCDCILRQNSCVLLEWIIVPWWVHCTVTKAIEQVKQFWVDRIIIHILIQRKWRWIILIITPELQKHKSIAVTKICTT